MSIKQGAFCTLNGLGILALLLMIANPDAGRLWAVTAIAIFMINLLLLIVWIVLPNRRFCAAIENCKTTSQRMNEQSFGLLEQPAQAVNTLLEDFFSRDQQSYLENQRYLLIAKLSDDVIFEYDLINDTISDSTNWDLVINGTRYLEQTVSQKIVHPEDAQEFLAFFSGEKKTGDFLEVELRFCTEQGEEYRWMQVRGIILGNKDGRSQRILGRRYNIDKLRREREALLEQAQRDPLTGLYNKKAAEELIESLLEEPLFHYCALMIIDIDHFKNVNDSLGHQAGDEVLKEAAAGIAALFRQEDVVGRIGGDEFLAMLRSKQPLSTEALERRCEQIVGVCRQMSVAKRYGHVVSCSVGVAVYPQDGNEFSVLFRRADVALYDAKKQGRDRYVYYRNIDMIDAVERLRKEDAY